MKRLIRVWILIVLTGLQVPRPGWTLDSEGNRSARPVSALTWRWGAGSSPRHRDYASPSGASLFDSGHSWGWKEWAIVVGSVAAIAGIVVVATHKSGGGGSSGSGGGGY